MHEISKLSCIVLLAINVLTQPNFAQAQTQDISITHQFTPQPQSKKKFDYSIWTEILEGIVVSAGPSTRHRLSRNTAITGNSRINIGKGHRSPYRMEGNRVVFSQMSDTWRQNIEQYAQDLESLGNQVNIVQLPKDEQLAFWLNLHNATLIDLITQHYPIKTPHDFILPAHETALHAAKVLNIDNTALSLRDIREKIVYSHWNDPKVIYGFFLGNIGSPTIQKSAYTGNNVHALLRFGAKEFINSLRGVHRWDDHVRISELYEDTQIYYFKNFENDLRRHLHTHADDRVKTEIGSVPDFRIGNYQYAIADIAGGTRLGSQSAIKIYSQELTQKFRTLKRQGKVKTGTVIIEDIPTNSTN